MKQIKRMGFIVLAMLLLAACGDLPTDGLTASMGTDQTDSSQQGASIHLAVTQCTGEWNPENNMLRLSFQLETDEDVFGSGDAEELRLFGGGTMLMDRWAYVQAEPSGNFRLHCEEQATMTAVPLSMFDKVMKPVWLAALSVPQLTVESPSEATETLESVPIRGLLAPSATDIPKMIGAAYDLNPNDVSYQSFFAAQKALHENDADSAFVREVAQNNGLSARNAAHLGELYVAQDVDRRQALLLDMLTSPEDEEYAEAVVDATVKTLAGMGFDFQTISNVFEEETEGRVTVQFRVRSDVSALDVQITNRDGANSVEYTALYPESSGSSSGIINAETGEILWSVLNGAAEGAAFVAAANARFAPGGAIGALLGDRSELTWWHSRTGENRA